MKARTAFAIVAILCLNFLLTGAAAADTAAPPLRLPLDRSTPINDVVSPDAPTSAEPFSFSIVAAGYSHTCALTDGGGVKCWGYNGDGVLGDGTTISRSTPVDVSGLSSGVTALTAGRDHTCALTAAGGVKCWGTNSNGQLGDGTTTRRITPTDVSGLSSGIVALAAGDRFTGALTVGGGVKCWGYNWAGQLGDGTTTSRNTPVDVSGLSSGGIALTTGWGHTCAVMDAAQGGGAKCWGENWSGQLGDGTTSRRTTAVNVSGLTNGVIALTAGVAPTCALITGGEARCWGSNYNGQPGDGTTTNHSTPVDVSGLGNGIITLVAGGDHTCAVSANGGAKCLG